MVKIFAEQLVLSVKTDFIITDLHTDSKIFSDTDTQFIARLLLEMNEVLTILSFIITTTGKQTGGGEAATVTL